MSVPSGSIPQPQPQPQPVQGVFVPQTGQMQIPLPPPTGWPQQFQNGQPPAGGASPAPSRMQLGGDEILDGPGVPAELRGRKVSEVMRIYNSLADDFITRRRAQPGQAPMPPAQQPGVGTQPQPQSQPPAPASDSSFWQNPTESLRTIVQQVVQEAVGPFQQQTLAQGSRTAYEQARTRIPDFAALEADIVEIVKGSTAEALAVPEYWEHAADLARGRRARAQQAQQQPPQASQASQNFPFSVPAQQGYPQAVPPQPQQPAVPAGYTQPPTVAQQYFVAQQRPPTHSFFTEAPTAPSPYSQTHAGALSPAQLEVARLSGISPDQYAAWAAVQQRGR